MQDNHATPGKAMAYEHQDITLDVQEQQQDAEPVAAVESPLIPKWRIYILILGLCLSLLLSTLETTIVSTALVSITNELAGFSQRDWIVTSYLLTYTGFLTIFAKFSDIFGRKVLLLLSLIIFVLFSILCGASRSLTALIVLRAMQGIGGSGIYSLVSITTIQVVPPEKIGKYGAAISSVFALASILGPLLGGAITRDPNNWPWVFYLDGPLGLTAIALIVVFLPLTQADRTSISFFRRRSTTSSFARVDYGGAFLILSASILLVFVLEEAGIRFPWKSAAMIVCILLSGLLWLSFAVWEHHLVGPQKSLREPIFPVSLLKSRFIVGMMLYGFFSGVPFLGVVINLPQRFQAVNDVSPFEAGIYLLPLLLSSPIGAAACGYFSSTLKIPPFYLLLVGSVLQTLGLGLMISLPSTPLQLYRQQFAFEAIMGVGFGIGLTTLLVMVPVMVDKPHQPVMIGAITQIRVLGGTIGLAILAQVFADFTTKRLTSTIPSTTLQAISESVSNIAQFPETEQNLVRMAFADSYTLQMKILTGFGGLTLLSALLLWERIPRTV